MGPVINESSMNKILGYVQKAIQEGGRLITGGTRDESAGAGYFIKPTVVADVAPEATISQEEIFGPVLAILRCRDFEEGIRIANNTEFGLTGAVYTSSPDKLDYAAREYFVGNLYLNRKCTGAMVGAHPFGGFNMSGTDSKAGGPDYLLLFTQAKSVAEKVIR
jgi:1-pyrroline-5-carboxylate dehydrogenase